MKIAYTVLISAGIIFSQVICFSKAPDPNLVKKLAGSKGAASLYIENKGQIGDQRGKPNNEVKYLILRPGLNIQLKANSFSYDAYTVERSKRVERLEESFPSRLDKLNDDSLIYHFSRVDIELVDANPSPQITQEGASSDYLNYYTHITSQTQGEAGVTGVRGYSNIVYHDIYPNIDLEWFLDKDGKPEYQFIINPGGDPSKIRLKYHGAQKTELISENIMIYVSPGVIEEKIPLSYISSTKQRIEIQYQNYARDEYGFKYPSYAISETLIIDPLPVKTWSTFYGGNNGEFSKCICIDKESKILISGSASSNIIATSGSYQTAFAGYIDAFIAKFSQNGTREWGTFFGGSGADEALGVTTDNSSNVIITGLTGSTSGISTAGSHQINYGGGQYDGFLAKFSSNGTSRIWATYIGGDNWEDATFVSSDQSDNYYIVGCSKSSSGIATSGAFQENYAGNGDFYIQKFNTNGTRQWGTYYGGADYEWGYGIATDLQGNVIATAHVTSSGLASSGAFQTASNGGVDAFMTKFNTNGVRLWATYYGGNNGNETGNAVTCDMDGNIYIAGHSWSSNGMATNGVYQTTYSGGNIYGDAFLAKFSTSGNRIWGTYFGGNSDEYMCAVTTDKNGNTYITGKTESSSGIATLGSFQEVYAGSKDAFIAKFNSLGNRVWSAYLGGSGEDYGNGIATNDSLQLFVSGYTTSTNGVATDGAFQNLNGGGQDIFLAKIDDNLIKSVQSDKLNLCQNSDFEVSFVALENFNSGNVFSVELSSNTGSFSSPIVVGTKSSLSSGTISCRLPKNVTQGSMYRVRVVASNPSFISQDNGLNITVNPLPLPVINGPSFVCIGNSFSVYAVESSSGNSYTWQTLNKGEIIGSNSGNSINVRWLNPGYDTIRLRQTNLNTGCFSDTTFIVNVHSAPSPVITGSNIVCIDSKNNLYSVPNVTGHLFQWFPLSKGMIIGSNNSNAISVNWNSSGVDTIKLRQTNPVTGCFKDTTLLITIQGLPTPVITGKSTVCISENDDSYSVGNIPGHVYQWFVPTKGTVIGSVTSNSVRIQWKSSGIDTIKVRQTNPQTGCYKDTTLLVIINAQPSQSISGIANPCANNRAVQYSVPLNSSLSYEWGSLARGTILGSRNSNSIEVVWKNPGIDSLTLRTTNTQTGCTSDTSFVVRINSAPLPVISGTRSVCVSANPVEYSVPSNSNSRYSWSQPKLGTLIGVNDGNTVRVRWNTSGFDTVNVRETNLTNGCSTDTFVVVNVLPQPKPIITGNMEIVEQEKGLVYSVQQENGSTYEWIIVSGDATITTKSGHLVVLNVGARGAVILKVIQTNVDGCINESQFVITVKAPTSVQDVAHLMFTVYPNPTEASDELLVQIADLNTRVLQIELVDVMGVSMVKTSIEPNNGIIPLNIHGITSGMYIVRVHTAKGIFSEKVIVN